LWLPSAARVKARGVLKPEGSLQRFVGDDESGGILKTVRERKREKESNDGNDAKNKAVNRVWPRSLHLYLVI
jgi:hypothetical protein